MRLAENIETLFWPCGLYYGVFLLSEMQTREAYKQYLSLNALTPCVCFSPLAHFQTVVSHWERKRGFKDERNHNTDPTDISLSLNNKSYSISQWEVDMNFMCLHMVSISSSLLSLLRLYFNIAPFPILLSSPVRLPCYSCFSYSAPLSPLPTISTTTFMSLSFSQEVFQT